MAEFPLIEMENIVLELTRPVSTQETDVSNNNKSNEEENTEVTYNKELNEDTEEKMRNVDTNNTVLELSESPTNTRDVSNENTKDNNKKLKE